MAVIYHTKNCLSTSALPFRGVMMRPTCSHNFITMPRSRDSRKRFLQMSYNYFPAKLLAKNWISDRISMQPSSSTMQINYTIVIAHQLQRPYFYKCPRSHLLSFVMSWQGFLELANVPNQVLKLCQFLLWNPSWGMKLHHPRLSRSAKPR